MEKQTKNAGMTANAEKRKGSCRRYVLLGALVLCCAALLAGGTLAYFTAQETAYNVITTGTLEMELREETTGGKPFPSDGISGVMPGSAVDKKVYVVNKGSVDFYTRIAIQKVIVDAEGRKDTLNFDHIRLDLNTADWTEKDGYYYYNWALKPGEKTEPLFNTVAFGTELGNEYMDASVEILINAQAVQSKNNGAAPTEAVGWAAD